MGSLVGATYERIYDLIRRIPSGQVATYGQIAALAGRCTARQVGYALAALKPGSDVPWHRVVNRKGEISLRADGLESPVQQRMLELEGVVFQSGKIDLKQWRWPGPDPDPDPDPDVEDLEAIPK